MQECDLDNCPGCCVDCETGENRNTKEKLRLCEECQDVGTCAAYRELLSLYNSNN